MLRKTDTGGCFLCADPALDQPRVDAHEVSPAGPMFGPTMLAAEHEVARAEGALLAEEGISLDTFRAGRGETLGARRPYRVPLQGLTLEMDADELWLRFELPSGSYATVLLRELVKDASPA